MSRWVIDASVALKWLVPEEGSEAAESWLLETALLVPELLFVEISSALWKRVRRGEMTLDRAQSLLRALSGFGLRVHRDRALCEAALGIASTGATTVYDALYLALALREEAPLVTADSKLHAAMSARRPDLVRRLVDLPTG